MIHFPSFSIEILFLLGFSRISIPGVTIFVARTILVPEASRQFVIVQSLNVGVGILIVQVTGTHVLRGNPNPHELVRFLALDHADARGFVRDQGLGFVIPVTGTLDPHDPRDPNLRPSQLRGTPNPVRSVVAQGDYATVPIPHLISHVHFRFPRFPIDPEGIFHFNTSHL
jgi:hypothetical protein